MTDLAKLLSDIESAPEGSRELSDEMLLACGWKRDARRKAYWRDTDGRYVGISRPDPSRSLDAKLPGENIAVMAAPGYLVGRLIGDVNVGSNELFTAVQKGGAIGQAHTEPLARRAAAIRGMLEDEV